MARAIVIAAWGIAGAGHSEPVAAQDSGLQGARRTGARQVRIASERDGILQAVSGLTCKCDELMEKKKDDGQGSVKDKRWSISTTTPSMRSAATAKPKGIRLRLFAGH